MPKHSIRIAALIGTVLVVCAFAPAPATAQEKPVLLQIGMTLTYEGVQIPEGASCEVPYESYDQYIKVAGLVILPETKTNVYHLLEMWGRDSETLIVRSSPSNADVFIYDLGVEYPAPFLHGPVGTSWETTEPGTGYTLKYVVVADGLSRTLPTGVVYQNLTQVNTYCTSGCGNPSAPIEKFWMSPDLFSPVLVWVRNSSCPLKPRWEWLVSVTR